MPMTSKVMRMWTEVIQYVKYGLRREEHRTEAAQGRLGKGRLQSPKPSSPPREEDTQLRAGEPRGAPCPSVPPHRWLSVISSCDCTMLLRLRRYVLFRHLPTTPSP